VGLVLKEIRKIFVIESELVKLASDFGEKLIPGQVVYLLGDLGSGKTTFVRALLKSLGVSELIKSPTYTLIESYEVKNMNFSHMDLYRLKDQSELENLGIFDLILNKNILLIEWPEQGGGFLPEPSYILEFSHHESRPDLRGFKEIKDAC
jgi:tRNA threonylcarbamoyladenosine biosynthesis protein TsaE